MNLKQAREIIKRARSGEWVKMVDLEEAQFTLYVYNLLKDFVEAMNIDVDEKKIEEFIDMRFGDKDG
ncbi:hypothetical protein J7J18_05415 [bacterium]|nr:hypothetical protein [bacterium]